MRRNNKKKDEQTISVFRSERFSPSIITGATKNRTQLTPSSVPPYEHMHKQRVIDASTMLVGEDKHANLSQNSTKLVENRRKVDNTFVVNPVIEGDGEDWTEPLDFPLNLAE